MGDGRRRIKRGEMEKDTSPGHFFNLPFWACIFMLFCFLLLFGTRHIFLLHCLDSISECLDRTIRNTFSKGWEKHFDMFKHVVHFTNQPLIK